MTQKEGHGKKLRRGYGKTETDEKLGCQMTHSKWERLRKKRRDVGMNNSIPCLDVSACMTNGPSVTIPVQTSATGAGQ